MRLPRRLERQTATAEILRAMSESPTDLQPVLDTVVRAAARFCGATDVEIMQLEGDTLRGAAGFGPFNDVINREMGSLTALKIPVTRGLCDRSGRRRPAHRARQGPGRRTRGRVPRRTGTSASVRAPHHGGGPPAS